MTGTNIQRKSIVCAHSGPADSTITQMYGKKIMAEHPVQTETIKHTQTAGKQVPVPKQDEIKMEPGPQKTDLCYKPRNKTNMTQQINIYTFFSASSLKPERSA